MAELQRTSVGATPVFYTEAPPPFVGALVFRKQRPGGPIGFSFGEADEQGGLQAAAGAANRW